MISGTAQLRTGILQSIQNQIKAYSKCNSKAKRGFLQIPAFAHRNKRRYQNHAGYQTNRPGADGRCRRTRPGRIRAGNGRLQIKAQAVRRRPGGAGCGCSGPRCGSLNRCCPGSSPLPFPAVRIARPDNPRGPHGRSAARRHLLRRPLSRSASKSKRATPSLSLKR